MKRLKLNKKTTITAIYTIAAILAISFAVHPSTNSYFLKKKDQVLAYISSLEKTHLGSFESKLNEKEATEDKLILTLTLPRDVRYKAEGDVYKISAKSIVGNENVTCDIIPSSINQEEIIYNSAKKTFTFTPHNSGTLDIACDMSKNNEKKANINVEIELIESVNGEKEFSFASSTFEMSYNDYLDKFKDNIIPPQKEDENGNLVEKTDLEIYEEFIAILKAHVKKLAEDPDSYVSNYSAGANSWEDLFISYVDYYLGVTKDETGKVITSNAKSILLGENFDLMGVKRSEASDNLGNKIGYRFTFDDNITGYVKTHDSFRVIKKGIYANNAIYLSTTDSKSIRNAILNILTKYIFKNSDHQTNINGTNYYDVDLIMEYIDKYTNNNITIEKLEEIPGIKMITPNPDTYPFFRIYKEQILDVSANYLRNNKDSSEKTFIINTDYSKYKDDYDSEEDYEEEVTYMIEDSFIYSVLGFYEETYDSILKRFKSGNFDASLVCTTNCEDYYATYYNYADNKYYKVEIIHSSTYNRVSIKEFEDSSVNPIFGSEEFDKATICEENCKEYSEIQYDGAYYIIAKVEPDKDNGVNKITTIIKDAFADTLSLTNYDQSIKDVLLASYNSNDNIQPAIDCKTSCENYQEIYYDSKSNEYVLFKVSHIDGANILNSSLLMAKTTDSSKSNEMEETKKYLEQEIVRKLNSGNLPTINIHVKENIINPGTDPNIIYLDDLTTYLKGKFNDANYVPGDTNISNYISGLYYIFPTETN